MTALVPYRPGPLTIIDDGVVIGPNGQVYPLHPAMGPTLLPPGMISNGSLTKPQVLPEVTVTAPASTYVPKVIDTPVPLQQASAIPSFSFGTTPWWVWAALAVGAFMLLKRRR